MILFVSVFYYFVPPPRGSFCLFEKFTFLSANLEIMKIKQEALTMVGVEDRFSLIMCDVIRNTPARERYDQKPECRLESI